MATRTNQEIVQRYAEVAWSSGGDLAELDDLLASDFRDHSQPEGLPPGPEGHRQYLQQFRSAFSDMHNEAEDILVDEDKVAVRWSVRGTHSGDLMGIAATGRSISLTGITIYRLENGKIAESWAESNQLGLMQQLGVVPS
jgi:steroid delta-isomerase-like uncharacterized protein